MNLCDMNSDNITMNIDGIDIEMQHPICYGKEYNRWLVSKCGKVWSLSRNKFIKGAVTHHLTKKGKRVVKQKFLLCTPIDFWGDGSGLLQGKNRIRRNISLHSMIMDTWKPLYDNPPEGVTWEEWEKVRDLPSIYEYFIKSGSIDHIDDNPLNNHIDNLRRVNDLDNQNTRKAKGI